jgi:hypothetical protein
MLIASDVDFGHVVRLKPMYSSPKDMLIASDIDFGHVSIEYMAACVNVTPLRRSIMSIDLRGGKLAWLQLQRNRQPRDRPR